MAGLATRLLVAQKVLAELPSADAALYASAGLADPDNQKWYMFGALGTAIGDFVPSASAGLGAAPINPYFLIWQQVLSIAVGNSTVSPPVPGLVPTLQVLTSAVEKLAALVAAHDFSGMMNFKNSGQLDAINKASADLTTILSFFTQPANLAPITNQICAAKPRIDDPTRLVPTPFWCGRDWLHWKHTGDFAAGLMAAAQKQGDPRYLSYAIGWQVAFATLVCSSGFMNSVAGTSYRTYWWRSRWMDLVVDAWSWGYYGANATMREDVPDPPYDQWTSLCSAGLQDLIDLTGGQDPATVAEAVVSGQPLPDIAALDAFANDFWLPAWSAANGNPAAPVFTAQGLLTGYYMLWLVLWFQTSGAVVGCNPAPSATPPSTCGDNPQTPDWTDPTTTNPVTGQPFLPQEPTPQHDPNLGEVICGAILAALGLASLFFGGGIVGAGAITAGVALIVDGEEQLNWDQLDCQLYWLKIYLYHGLEALHKLTVLAGFQHPYPQDLGASQGPLKFGVLADIDYPVFGDMCRSVGVQSMLTPWTCNLLDPPAAGASDASLDWTQYPMWGAEPPSTLVWGWPGWWPDSFIANKQHANPGGSDITVAPASFDSGVSAPFPASVDAALQLIVTQPDSLPNWNLDGDRGLGWLTWQLTAPYTTPVAPVAET